MKHNFTIKCTQFNLDENFKMIGDPIFKDFSGSTLKEAKEAWQTAKDNNDITKFSALIIYDIINA